MFSTIKYYAMVFLGFLVVLFWGLLQSEKKARTQDKLRNVKAARAKEKQVNKATVEGLQNEADNKSNRNYDDDSII